jgi:hypothetical protein
VRHQKHEFQHRLHNFTAHILLEWHMSRCALLWYITVYSTLHRNVTVKRKLMPIIFCIFHWLVSISIRMVWLWPEWWMLNLCIPMNIKEMPPNWFIHLLLTSVTLPLHRWAILLCDCVICACTSVLLINFTSQVLIYYFNAMNSVHFCSVTLTSN